MRRAAKIDGNQREIVESLRQLPGISVYITSMIGNGFPDLIIGYKFKNYLIELKDGNKPASARKLTEPEREFFSSWRGSVYLCKSLDEILEVINKPDSKK